jgi:DNA polymerase-3 subunit alpha
MSKKKKEEMDKQRDKFVKGCAEKNKMPKAKAEKIFEVLEKFAGYGFNKSHAAAYALIAYQTAFLKANYPVEFMAALLSNDLGNQDKLAVFIAEARDMGIEVLPPDVNTSPLKFGVVPPDAQNVGGASVPRPGSEVESRGAEAAPTLPAGKIRFGLAAIKGVGETAIEAVIKAREAGGPFRDMFDFCERVDTRACNRRAIESLVKCGAFDFAKQPRLQIFNQTDQALGRAAAVQRDRASGQVSLFGAFDEPAPAKTVARPRPGEMTEWPENELLAFEKELMGFYLSGHPLAEYAPLLERYELHSTEKLKELVDRAPTRLGGLIVDVVQRVSSKTNKPWAAVSVEDLHGTVEVLCFDETFQKTRQHLVAGKAIFVQGSVNKRDEKPKIFANDIIPLDEVVRRYTKQVHLRVHTTKTTPEQLARIRDILARHEGRVPVALIFTLPGGGMVFADTHEAFNVAPSGELVKELEAVLGKDAVYLKPDTSMPKPESGRERWQRRAAADE